MAKPRDLRKQFESILGEEIDPDGGDTVLLRDEVGTRRNSEGFVTSREIGTTGASTRWCARRELLEVTGRVRTGAAGSITFLLSDFYCARLGDPFVQPINVVATPRSRQPRFVTVFANLVANNEDVTITIFGWDAAGAPVDTSVDWRVLVPFRPANDVE